MKAYAKMILSIIAGETLIKQYISEREKEGKKSCDDGKARDYGE